ncbi:alkene reductase [Solihabitans fulvus]|uniref:Alkene reductase n=1 Tax=Solihabitans fulvus TaxID=1892852 RepID=A0A5B2WE86_9PSEU|nr:alkene reductase [Solihabitans fulvus]KAA2250181.1 alkene reductase [Solihabitans fulvus]
MSLFDTMTLGKLELPNRLVMAPMTRSRATENGLATPLMAQYYAQRASAGLIISEGIQPSAVGQGYISTPGLHSAEQVESWRQVTDAVHEAGGRIFAQLMHSGRVGHPALHGQVPVAPSAVASGEQLYTPDGMLPHPTPRALTPAEIAATVEDFVVAARNAVDAGFDGVELHGANGYLVHQFLADNANLREDSYGGSIANRIRFALETITAIADAIGPERTGIRLSPSNPANGIAESDSAELYAELAGALPPLAYVHVMELGTREITEAIRSAWAGTLIVNPHETDPSEAASVEGAVAALAIADAVALARLWLANPDLPSRIRANGPYNEADRGSFYGGDHRGYTDYPTL